MMGGWGFAGGGYGGGGYPRSGRFEEQYHCYSVAYADKAHLEVRLPRCPFIEFLPAIWKD